MDLKTFKKYLANLNQYIILTKKRKFFIEASVIFVLCLWTINYIVPQSKVLYFLLIFPAILGIYIFILLFNKILKDPEQGIPIIASLLPFERIGSITIASINIRLSQIFIILTFTCFIIFYIRKYKRDFINHIKIKKDISFLFLITFLLINIISITVTTNKSRSLQVLLFDIFIFLSFIFISNLLRKKEVFIKAIRNILIVSTILGLYGIFQFAAGMLNFPTSISGLRGGFTKEVFGFPRVIATETEPQFWGNYLLISLGISFSILINFLVKKRFHIQEIRTSNFITLTSVIALFLGLINLLLTFSRGAWYASLVMFSIIFLVLIRKIITFKVIFITGVIILLSILVFSLVLEYTHAPLNVNIFTNRATSIVDNDRVLTTNAAIHAFESHPMLGIGAGGFGPYMAENPYQKPSDPIADIGWRIVNNEYLEILAETGVIGFISFMIFLASVIVKPVISLIKEQDEYILTIMIGLIGTIAGFLTQYFAFSTLYIMQVWFIIALLNAASFNINTGKWKRSTKE